MVVLSMELIPGKSYGRWYLGNDCLYRPDICSVEAIFRPSTPDDCVAIVVSFIS